MTFKQSQHLTTYAKANRKLQTEAEKHLWYYLKNRKLNGYKFRRQFPILNYIVDFYCEELNLGIELDGSQHQINSAYDINRTKQLKRIGISIIRFWDNNVFQNIESVLETIIKNDNYNK